MLRIQYASSERNTFCNNRKTHLYTECAKYVAHSSIDVKRLILLNICFPSFRLTTRKDLNYFISDT